MNRRHELNEEQWRRILPLLPAEHPGRRGRPWVQHRKVINGILWVLRTGAQWEEMPARYGSYKTANARLLRWQRDGTWRRVLQCIQATEDARGNVEWEGCAADATIVKAHQDAAGARRPEQPAKPAAREKGGPASDPTSRPLVAANRRRKRQGPSLHSSRSKTSGKPNAERPWGTAVGA